MADQTVAASSPAEVSDVFNGENVSLAEFNRYRQDGELPDRFKPAETADPAPAAETPEGDEPETAPASEPEEAQEQPKPGSSAEKRIKQLLAKTKELERKLETAAKQDAKPDSSPAQPQPPQTYQDYRKAFKPAQYIEEYAKANPDASYEDANAAMADHLLDAREHFRSIETRVQAEAKALNDKVDEARNRYADFDEIKTNFLAKVISDRGTPLIPLQVLGIVNDSDVLADLLYTIGSDDAELAKFVDMAKTNPNKAIRYVAKVESLIAEELGKPKDTPVRGEDGKFKTPEKKQTSAPKPAATVNSGTAKGRFDVSDESISNEEWMRQRNKQVGKG